jgi:hypothetical protein
MARKMKEQLQLLNARIRTDNEQAKREKRYGRAKPVRDITDYEFWVWWGIVLATRIEGRKGNMWDRLEPEGYGKKVDMSQYMAEYRFKTIRAYIPFLFCDPSREADDPWWQFSLGIEEYNNNRQSTVKSSFLKIMDESMSAFRPQTTKTGNLPHLSKIDRKPEDLGTELKATADCATGLCIFLEIQKGKVAMADEEFVSVMKATSACC